MASAKKEMQKRMLIRKTIMAMDKQIKALEEQKEKYVASAKQAKERGLTSQYNLAMSGLKMTMAQQKRIYEMKLNFEITSQMKDMMQMTSSFLGGMQSLSKDMVKITKEKSFAATGKDFAEAMVAAEMQTQQIEAFMDETEAAFSAGTYTSAEDQAELDSVINAETGMGSVNDAADFSDADIEKELAALKNKM